MKTISLMDIKEKLNELYTKCDLLDNYNINSKELRSEIISIDTLCDNLSDDSNLSNSNVKVKGDYKSLYLRYSILNDKINNYLKSLHIFNIIQKVNKDIKKEDLNKLLEEILNDLMNYNNSKLELEEFNSLYPSLYQLIKLEFKYTGKSIVLNYIRNSSLDQYKIDELFYDELSERFYSPLINKITLQTATKNYIEYDKYLLYLSVIEDGYLDEIFEELEKYNVENSNLYFILNEIKEKTKNQKEINDTNKRMKYKQYTRLFPALLSLIILISANTAAKDKIDEKTSSYKTTTEVYDTIDGYSTNISYDTLEVGDIKITVYNKMHNNHARVIREFEFNDSEFDLESISSLDYNNMDFSSSEYKYDEESINKSTDQYMTANKVIDVDYSDIKINRFKNILLHMLLSLPIIIIDGSVGYYLYYAVDNYNKNKTLTTLILTFKETLRLIKENIQEINKRYKYASIKNNKKELKKLEKEITDLQNRYDIIYDKYLYLESLLNEKGYERKLRQQ